MRFWEVHPLEFLDTENEFKTRSVEIAISMGIHAFKSGDIVKSKQICKDILQMRPFHKGALHLLMTLEHKVNNLVFTAIGLNNPSNYDVGDYSYGVPIVHPHNQISEPSRLTIGKYCTIGHDVKIYLGSSHRHDTFTIFPFSAPHFGSLFSKTKHIKDFSSTKGGVNIGNDVWIGAHSVILPGVKIGNGAVIGAGSVVSRNVGPYEIWAGNSATYKRSRFDGPIINRLQRLRWWEMPIEKILENASDIMSGSTCALSRLESLKQQLMPSADSNYQYVMGYSGYLRYKLFKNFNTDCPTWVVLHGSLGSINSVVGITNHIKNKNLLFLDLPGCGESSLPPEMTIDSIANELSFAIAQLVDGPYRILGASFGGAVGLKIANEDKNCKGVVLIDTPMSAKKLWHNHIFLREMINKNPDNQFVRKFALEIYGVTEHATVEKDFWYLLDKVKVPIEFITGDISMTPIRSFQQVPVCLDEQDIVRLNAVGIKINKVAGGHNLIQDNPQAIAKIVARIDA